jgi:hypothetical protein
MCWSQWPRGLRHELSLLAQTLVSWVRIPLKAWMSVCVYSVFVISCVGSGLAMASSPIQGVLPTFLGLRNWCETKCFTDALCSKVGARGGGGRQTERDRVSKCAWITLPFITPNLQTLLFLLHNSILSHICIYSNNKVHCWKSAYYKRNYCNKILSLPLISASLSLAFS